MKAKLIKLAAAATLALGVSSAWAAGIMHQGEVVETMNSGGYTYVQVKAEDKTFWAAGPQVAITKGDTVIMNEQMWMQDFTSSTLNKTFDKLLFVGKIEKK
ncbi:MULTISPECIES: NrfJ [unclassified Shewanella]|uniref:NrfJ n=1 Tax=unclassified Shewanella TaxID=196818 RepID=UPI000C817D3B|nr:MULTISPECIES: NrfJ [unclassified Shewanella]MDO6619905.1 NrfJ [Shewanella sp. 6_MG-2023]MDO6641058.1 NrfJ [Shewanella sp. 5_MG-2023]MDO6679115.1 NrfJ [Shewanella sp. 4_MG-2023]MDO6776340.1 NrfJ [Shewanella sp. 3_MG-2023]PMG41888.1 NrfJ [Shewanella sp. 10N.286.52.B9]